MDKSLEKIQAQYHKLCKRRLKNTKAIDPKNKRHCPLTLQGLHPLVDAAESSDADHLSPLTHNYYPWWQGLPAIEQELSFQTKK